MKKMSLMLMLGFLVSMGTKAQTTVPVAGIKVPGAVTVYFGEDTTLIAKITPENATNKTVAWKIESPASGVITIDTTGADKTRCVIRAIGVGEEVVTVKTAEGNFTASCTVTVVKPVTEIKLDGGGGQAIHLLIDRDTILKVKIQPFDATNPAVIWECRDSSVVDILSTEENRTDSLCRIRPLRPGTTRITVKAVEGGWTDSCDITVVSATIDEFTLNCSSFKRQDTLDLFAGRDTALIARIRPLAGTYKYVSWSNSNYPAENVIAITSSGYDTICRIRATGVGTARIGATTFDGQTDTCFIRVHDVPADTMYLKTDTLRLNNRDHRDTVLIAVVKPANVSRKTVTFTSSNSLVADIVATENDTLCRIAAGYSGEAWIYAATADGRFLDSCYVRVIVPVDSIVLEAKNAAGVSMGDGTRIDLDLVADSVVRLTARLYPDSVTKSAYEPLKWSRLDTSLVKGREIADDTLEITALRSGVTVIMASTADGAWSSWLNYIHIAPRKVDSVRISADEHFVTNDTIHLNVRDSCRLIATVYPWNATNDTLVWDIMEAEPGIVAVDSTDNGVFLRGLKPGIAVLRAQAADGGTYAKNLFMVKVKHTPVTDIFLSRDTIYTYENHLDTVSATILPPTTTQTAVNWSTTDAGVVALTDASTVVCTFKGVSADTAMIRAEINGCKDSVIVIVKKQFVFVDSDTTAANGGRIAFSLLNMPDNVMLTGSFTLQLPKGFGLTLKPGGGFRTELEAPYRKSSDLHIEASNDSTYTFRIALKAMPLPSSVGLRADAAKKKIMDIAYTVYDNGLLSSTALYDAKLKDVHLTSSDGTEFREDHTARIKVFRDPTGNTSVEAPTLNAYLRDHRLYVHSAQAETVSVYSSNGALLFSKEKTAGSAVFRVDTPEKILIVKGSSGWTQKVANQ
jgi:uncharacterized protein YjdB